MATKKKAAKKAKTRKKFTQKIFEAGEPIIIGGGSGLIKAAAKRVILSFLHDVYGPDPDNCGRWINGDYLLKQLRIGIDGGPHTPYADLNVGDTVKIICSKGATDAHILIKSSAAGVTVEFDGKNHRYKRNKHIGDGFEVKEVFVNTTSKFKPAANIPCEIEVTTVLK